MGKQNTTPQPPPLERRGGKVAPEKAPSSSEEGVGGGGVSRRTLLARAAEMRKNPPEPERVLWKHLRASQLGGHKFRRQAVIDQRIVNFFCPAKGLVVEVDGDTHDPATDRRADDNMLTDHGFTTLRFTNHEVMHNLDGVLEHLAAVLEGAENRWGDDVLTTPQSAPLKKQGSVVSDALRDATERLAATSPTARLDAELLMAQALGVSRSQMLLHGGDRAVPTGFAALVERRMKHEPVAYILGQQEFFGRPFRVTPDVLIPRADSEAVVAAALERMRPTGKLLDLGTGSGALVLTVLAEMPGWRGIGIDRSAAALEVAADNAVQLDLAQRVQWAQRDWTRRGWRAALGTFDLVIANPPYVETDAALEPDVRDYEPTGALLAGPDGLDDYRRLVPVLRELLGAEGFAVLEIGHRQDAAVSALALEHGFAPHLVRDLAHRPRGVVLT